MTESYLAMMGYMILWIMMWLLIDITGLRYVILWVILRLLLDMIFLKRKLNVCYYYFSSIYFLISGKEYHFYYFALLYTIEDLGNYNIRLETSPYCTCIRQVQENPLYFLPFLDGHIDGAVVIKSVKTGVGIMPIIWIYVVSQFHLSKT